MRRPASGGLQKEVGEVDLRPARLGGRVASASERVETAQRALWQRSEETVGTRYR